MPNTAFSCLESFFHRETNHKRATGMTKRPTVGRSFFEFAKFLKELLRKIDLVFVPLRVVVGRVLVT